MEEQLKKAVERLDIRDSKFERMERVEQRVSHLEDQKVDFGDKLAKKIAELEGSANMHMGTLNQVVEEARQEFAQLRGDLQAIFQGADQKFKEIEKSLAEGSKHGKGDSERQGYVPRKMAYPEVFSAEFEKWRDWKIEITKYVDGIHKGMKQ